MPDPAADYTRQVYATCSTYDLVIMVRPDADLDGTFTAWDEDEHEFIRVNGWLWTFEEA